MLTRMIRNFFMHILFGQDSLAGYYVPPEKKVSAKNYIFSSVFPSRAVMEIALEEDPH